MWHQIDDMLLIVKASLNVDMVMFFVICFLSFHMFPESLSFSLAFVAPANVQGRSGGPLELPVGPSGAIRRHQIVDTSLRKWGFKRQVRVKMAGAG